MKITLGSPLNGLGEAKVGATLDANPVGRALEQTISRSAELAQWSRFKHVMQQLDEPLLVSILHQLKFVSFEPAYNRVTVNLDHNLIFFQELLQEQRAIWLPRLQAQFGAHTSLEFKLVQPAVLPEMPEIMGVEVGVEAGATTNPELSSANHHRNHLTGQPVAVGAANQRRAPFTDPVQWPKTSLILDFFPGTVSEMTDDQNDSPPA